MYCVRCEQDEEKVLALFRLSEDVLLCSQCVEECYGKLSNITKRKKTTNTNGSFNIKVPSVKSLIEHLDSFVVGQEDAKKTLTVAVRNHFKRLTLPNEERKYISKSNVMLVGPSGTGKTELVKRLAEFVDVPMVVVDANSYTSAGYTGEDIENMIAKLYDVSGNDKDSTEHGIIFIDEIDKKKREKNTNTKDVGGEEVQKGLLKLIEGRDVKVGATTINTSNILFIAAGAFVGIEELVKARMNQSKGSGFFKGVTPEDINSHITNDDLIKFGMIPEFIGRIPVVAYTKALTEDELVKITTEPKTSIYKQYVKLFEIDGIKLTIDDGVIRKIVRQSIKDKVGVRGLHKQFDDLLKEHQYIIEQYREENITGLTFTLKGTEVVCKTSKAKAKKTATKKGTLANGV